MTHWQQRCRFFASENPLISKSPVVFVGDSLTEEFDLAHFFPGLIAVNRGISGDHIDGLCERFAVSVADLRPGQVFVMIGINDLGRGDRPETLKSAYLRLLKLLRTLPQCSVFVQSLLPTADNWPVLQPEIIRQINTFLSIQSDIHGFFQIDFFPQFATADGYIKPAFTSDGLHLSKTGYALWAKLLNPHINIL